MRCDRRAVDRSISFGKRLREPSSNGPVHGISRPSRVLHFSGTPNLREFGDFRPRGRAGTSASLRKNAESQHRLEVVSDGSQIEEDTLGALMPEEGSPRNRENGPKFGRTAVPPRVRISS
ncbi:hypothetical protein TNCT_483311 [Trichonephila clavata]|uniref:Uncharacterized protein n=1 Tax=Trichonephila clavata TaxID=2740835 RepID=A0A8X6K9N4_TRICU|nr:hypothetical protein TNCT_483311 [Trichonephila clavata]